MSLTALLSIHFESRLSIQGRLMIQFGETALDDKGEDDKGGRSGSSGNRVGFGGGWK